MRITTVVVHSVMSGRQVGRILPPMHKRSSLAHTGGDDDASGTSALLSLGRLFKAYNVRFNRTVVLAFFSGEEQGLWGSRGYAKHLKDNGTDVKFMLQADMLGYHEPGEPMQIAFPDRYDTIEAVSRPFSRNPQRTHQLISLCVHSDGSLAT